MTLSRNSVAASSRVLGHRRTGASRPDLMEPVTWHEGEVEDSGKYGIRFGEPREHHFIDVGHYRNDFCDLGSPAQHAKSIERETSWSTAVEGTTCDRDHLKGSDSASYRIPAAGDEWVTQ